MQGLIAAVGNGDEDCIDCVFPARGQEAALGSPAMSGRLPRRDCHRSCGRSRIWPGVLSPEPTSLGNGVRGRQKKEFLSSIQQVWHFPLLLGKVGGPSLSCFFLGQSQEKQGCLQPPPSLLQGPRQTPGMRETQASLPAGSTSEAGAGCSALLRSHCLTESLILKSPFRQELIWKETSLLSLRPAGREGVA